MYYPACQEIIDKWSNTSLKKIVNVYQLSYKDCLAPGFGDYIRGCFSMNHFINTVNLYCRTNIKFDMDIRNHPMSNYIVTDPPDSTIKYNEVCDFKLVIQKVIQNSYDEKFRFVLNEIITAFNKIKEAEFYTFCCKFEIYDEIKEFDKEFMRSKLKPNEIMSTYIQDALTKLNLRRKEYSVLHIRCGDKLAFPPKELTPDFLTMLDNTVENNIDPNKTYLVLSDHNGIKAHYTCQDKPKFLTRQSEICHLGADNGQQIEQTKDTLLDFFLLSEASDIIGITPYGICGFSQECAKLYNIPFKYIRIPDNPENFSMAHLTPEQRIAYDYINYKDKL